MVAIRTSHNNVKSDLPIHHPEHLSSPRRLDLQKLVVSLLMLDHLAKELVLRLDP